MTSPLYPERMRRVAEHLVDTDQPVGRADIKALLGGGRSRMRDILDRMIASEFIFIQDGRIYLTIKGFVLLKDTTA